MTTKQKYKSGKNRQAILFDINDVPELEDMNPDSPSIDELNREDEQKELAAVEAASKRQVMRFISFGSGSSGNCSFVGTESQGVLIDAGVDTTKVFKELADNGIRPETVKGIVITHDHGDHVRYAYNIARKYKHIHVYCTPRTLNGIFRRHNVSRRLKEVHEPIFKEIPFTLAGMRFTAFEVSHDGTDNSGFFIEYGDQHFVVATDLGCITDRAFHYMIQADYLMIEANYDADMLTNGHYPEYLKNRIRANNGHLDNRVTAAFVADNYTERLKNVFLCHLSHDNNTPEVAVNEVRKALEARGVTVGEGRGTMDDLDKAVQLVALPRFDSSALFMLKK